jgi:nicotinamidase-related amidase
LGIDSAREIIPHIKALCELAPDKTVFTRFIPPMNSREAPGRWVPFYERWADMTLDKMPVEKVERFEELAPYVQRGALTVDKQTYSPWLKPHLQDALSDRKAVTLVFSGIETEMCVMATLLGAIDRGYRTILCIDAITSSARDYHEAVLSMLDSQYGEQLEHATVEEFADYAKG